MEIYKTMLVVNDDPEMQGHIIKMDTIEHNGQFWLVPEWLSFKEDETIAPARLIGLHSLQHQDTGVGGDFRFALNLPIPKDILDGFQMPPPALPVDIIEGPPLRMPAALKGI